MAGMTRKDFQAIADVLADHYPGDTVYFHSMMNTGAAYHWEKMVKAFADMCKAQNSRFDRDRFYRACRYDETEFRHPGPVEAKRPIKARVEKGEKA